MRVAAAGADEVMVFAAMDDHADIPDLIKNYASARPPGPAKAP